MKFNKVILVSALISTLSLPAWATSDVDQDSAVTTNSVGVQMPNGMPMNMQDKMKMGQQNSMPASAAGAGQHAGSLESQQGMKQGGMPMMKMMPQNMAEMKQHREQVETHLSNIDSSLKQLVELQKTK